MIQAVRTRTARALIASAMILIATPARAQGEDVEPREVAGAGLTVVGFSGFIDRVMSSETVFPLHATVHVDVTRFVSNRVAIRGGAIGSTRLGGEDEEPTGPGVLSLQATVAGLYYFTPLAMASFYSGGEYRAQLTHRPDRDAGTVLGLAGLQAVVSSRVGLFVEGGYGARLTRGSEDERQTQIVGAVGIRIKF